MISEVSDSSNAITVKILQVELMNSLYFALCKQIDVCKEVNYGQQTAQRDGSTLHSKETASHTENANNQLEHVSDETLPNRSHADGNMKNVLNRVCSGDLHAPSKNTRCQLFQPVENSGVSHNSVFKGSQCQEKGVKELKKQHSEESAIAGETVEVAEYSDDNCKRNICRNIDVGESNHGNHTGVDEENVAESLTAASNLITVGEWSAEEDVDSALDKKHMIASSSEVHGSYYFRGDEQLLVLFQRMQWLLLRAKIGSVVKIHPPWYDYDLKVIEHKPFAH